MKNVVDGWWRKKIGLIKIVTSLIKNCLRKPEMKILLKDYVSDNIIF